MIQMPSIVVVPGRSRMIVGSEMRTMFESSNAMNVPIVVFVSTTYLYCIRAPWEGRRNPSGPNVLAFRAPPTAFGSHRSLEKVTPRDRRPCDPMPRKSYRPVFYFPRGERMAVLPAFLKLKVDHKTVLCRDLNAYRALRDFLLNSGYSSVYETDRVGEAKTAMATFACLSSLTGERLAVVLGMSAPEEVSHAQAPFAYGFAGKPQKDAQTYMQHLALRTTDIDKLKAYLESKGAEFLTPIYKDKDSFGPLLQSFTRELFDDEWFFIEFVQRDYDADKVGAGGTQFVQNTVKSLYVSKQEEFREWEKTGKKRKFLDGVPEKERTNLLRDILVNTEPKGYVETVAPITRHVKLT